MEGAIAMGERAKAGGDEERLKNRHPESEELVLKRPRSLVGGLGVSSVVQRTIEERKGTAEMWLDDSVRQLILKEGKPDAWPRG